MDIDDMKEQWRMDGKGRIQDPLSRGIPASVLSVCLVGLCRNQNPNFCTLAQETYGCEPVFVNIILSEHSHIPPFPILSKQLSCHNSGERCFPQRLWPEEPKIVTISFWKMLPLFHLWYYYCLTLFMKRSYMSVIRFVSQVHVDFLAYWLNWCLVFEQMGVFLNIL